MAMQPLSIWPQVTSELLIIDHDVRLGSPERSWDPSDSTVVSDLGFRLMTMMTMTPAISISFWPGHLYINSDVYGFGVVLLELLTGLQALDSKRPSGQHNLVDWAKPSLSEKRKLKKIVDPRLDNEYPPKAAAQVAKLILECLEGDQRKRPSMEDVLATLELVNTIKLKPREVRPRSEQLVSRHGDQRSPSHHHHRHDRRRHQHRSPLHHRAGQEGGSSSARSL